MRWGRGLVVSCALMSACATPYVADRGVIVHARSPLPPSIVRLNDEFQERSGILCRSHVDTSYVAGMSPCTIHLEVAPGDRFHVVGYPSSEDGEGFSRSESFTLDGYEHRSVNVYVQPESLERRRDGSFLTAIGAAILVDALPLTYWGFRTSRGETVNPAAIMGPLVGVGAGVPLLVVGIHLVSTSDTEVKIRLRTSP